jgi:hypothetical protein
LTDHVSSVDCAAVYCVVSGHDRVGVLWSSQTTRIPWASISRLLLTPNSFVY